MSELNDLLDELEALSKAMPAPDEKDDAKIQAASEESEPDGDEGQDNDEGDEDEDDENEDEEDEEDDLLGKSVSATLTDGTVIDAYDGTELIKSLLAVTEVQGASLLKAVGATTKTVREMQQLLKAQSVEIKTLRNDLARIGNEGRGRKAMLNIHEKPAVTPDPNEGAVSGRELMTKAMSAFRQGRLSGTEVATFEAYLGRGATPPGHLIEKLQ